MKKIIAIFFLSATVISSCYYDVEEELYGSGGPCDTAGTTYSTTVVSLLQNYGCLGCHSGASASGNIRLDSYNNVKIQADNGRLFGAINHSAGYAPMPQGGNKMLSCDINKIKAWIDAGSPNN
jgi:hypothetical protein